jgi:hypothetical protein
VPLARPVLIGVALGEALDSRRERVARRHAEVLAVLREELAKRHGDARGRGAPVPGFAQGDAGALHLRRQARRPRHQ